MLRSGHLRVFSVWDYSGQPNGIQGTSLIRLASENSHIQIDTMYALEQLYRGQGVVVVWLPANSGVVCFCIEHNVTSDPGQQCS